MEPERSRTTEIYIKESTKQDAKTIHVGAASDSGGVDALGTVEIDMSELLHVQIELRKFFSFLRKPNQYFKNLPPGDFLPSTELARLAAIYDENILRWIKQAAEQKETVATK